MKRWFLIVGALASVVVGFILLKGEILTPKNPAFINQEFSYSERDDFDRKIQVLSLESIFRPDHSWVGGLPDERVRILVATGDVLMARTVNYKTVRANNFKWPFEKVVDTLKGADVTFVNLETPLVKNCPLTNAGMIFCGDIRSVEGLVFAGVDVTNFANNHAENYGASGVGETREVLTDEGILVTGVSGPVYKDVDGLKFAFLGYSEVGESSLIADADEDVIAQQVRQAKENSDIVVVQFHWGNEYVSQPTAKQRTLAHLAVDSGADLILGNHPHWIQPIEIYKDKVTVYSHGNFVFDQMWSQKTREGIIGKYTFFDDKLVDVEFLPIEIFDFGQPRFASGEKKRMILDEIKSESEKI